MQLNPTTDQAQAVGALRRLLEKLSQPEHVRAAEASGFDPGLWGEVVGMGIPMMGVPEQAGGLGLGLMDLALMAEVCGEFLAAIPFV